MEKDKGHIVNIEKVEINNITNNHIDAADIFSQLQTIKMQNHKILNLLNDQVQGSELKRQMDQWLARLSKSIGAIEKVSDRVK